MMKKQRTYISQIILALVLLAGVSREVSFAGVEVYPTYLFLNSPNRSVSVSVSNPTNTRQEIWIEYRYGYPVAGDSGKFAMHYIEPPVPGSEPSAVQWLKAYPQRFVLSPGESQVVRIMVTPPMGILPGEYWGRVVIGSTEREIKKTIAPGTSPVSRFQYISQIDIPLHFRFGSVNSTLTIRDFTSSVVNGKLTFDVNLIRSGNASYWGTMTTVLKEKNGKIIKSQNDVVAIYKDMLYPGALDVQSVPPGTYSLEVTFSPKRRGLHSQFTLRSDPVKYTKEIIIP
jgi:hypothetical protein